MSSRFLKTANNLKFAFVLVCLNRFQQIITCHTFQAPNDNVKVCLHNKILKMQKKKRTFFIVTLCFLDPMVDQTSRHGRSMEAYTSKHSVQKSTATEQRKCFDNGQFEATHRRSGTADFDCRVHAIVASQGIIELLEKIMFKNATEYFHQTCT